MLLERAGHEVVTAENGRRGLRTFYETRPDLVMLDIRMPELDGWQTLERLRDLSDVPVLMFSGTTPAAEQLERLRPGRDAFRPKPFFGNDLVDVVGELLEAAATRRIAPVVKDASSLSSHATAPAISSGWPARPSGIRAAPWRAAPGRRGSRSRSCPARRS